MIEMNFGGQFNEDVLIKYIKCLGSDYIIQGQVGTTLANHPKPQSLDVWLRITFPQKCDTKLADNYVLDALVSTGKFEIAPKLTCPTSGELCKGLKLI